MGNESLQTFDFRNNIHHNKNNTLGNYDIKNLSAKADSRRKNSISLQSSPLCDNYEKQE